ncbi:MAG: hypothetical protein KJ065_09280 [Anaerolineae bacterium]|nr:hypothetical protein [Anaerolineae bacterium]
MIDFEALGIYVMTIFLPPLLGVAGTMLAFITGLAIIDFLRGAVGEQI